MTQPAPAPEPAPSVPPAPPQGAPAPGQAVTADNFGLLSHVLEHVHGWFSRDVAPDLADLKVTAARVRELVPHLQALAGVVETLARMPGVSSQVAADAGEAAAEVARIAGELAAAGI